MSKINNGRTCRNEDLQAIGITTVIIPYSSRLEGAIANPGCRLSNDKKVAYFDTRPGLGVAITFAAFCREHLNNLTLEKSTGEVILVLKVGGSWSLEDNAYKNPEAALRVFHYRATSDRLEEPPRHWLCSWKTSKESPISANFESGSLL